MEQSGEQSYKGLPIKHISIAAQEALMEINTERADEQTGLYCRWSGINRGMGKYWRFNHITEIAAPSGHGKSYAINQLHDDFTDFKDILNPDNTVYRKALNSEYKGEVVIIHFGFEMDASDEVIRNLSRKIVKSYHYIMSSEYSHIDQAFNKISDAEMNMIEDRMNYIKTKPIYYVETAGTVQQMWATVGFVKSKHPKARLIVSLDHLLLTRRGDTERSDDDLISAVAFFALSLRKQEKAMVILLAQTNQNIKSIDRMTQPALHYPNDSDIYRGAQINWCCDNIWIFPYRPELINLPKYGVEQRSTAGLVIAACVKSRKGIIGDVFLKNDLSHGGFVE